jgi:glycosyltransferase involved in cell wall biosynthesis
MTVRTLIIVPSDLAGPKIGGIESFVKGFIKYAPEDFEIEHIGTTSDFAARPVGRWGRVEIGGRPIRMLPIVNDPTPNQRRNIPLDLRFTICLARYRRHYTTAGRILQFHRAGTSLPFVLNRCRKIQVVHFNVADIYKLELGESRWRLLPSLYHRIDDVTLPAMNRIFVVNRGGVEFYHRRRPKLATRIKFLPTWVDDEIFAPPSATARRNIRAIVRRELSISGDAALLLFVGRLEAQKDPILLLQSFARFAPEPSSAQLLLIGDGSMRVRCETAARALGVAARVHFLNSRSQAEVARLMCASDALVSTSAFEGMPISVIEALATGLPVIAPAVGEIPRLVTTGRSGWVTSERTAEAFAAAMAWITGHEAPIALLRQQAIAAAAPYHARQVLDDFYTEHRLCHSSLKCTSNCHRVLNDVTSTENSDTSSYR